MESHFGLHTDGDLVFLHQGRWGRCVTPGLEALPAPFRVMRRDGRRCPHNITPAAGSHPQLEGLARVLAPVPDGGAYWVPEQAMPAVSAAHQMASPVHPIVFPAWNTRVRDLAPQVSLTNIAPLIIVGIRPIDIPAVASLLAIPRVRTILLVGGPQPGGAVEVDWTLPSVSDWRRVGGAVLHDHIIETVEKARSQ